MIIKIGNKIYTGETEPIMVVFNQEDKKLLQKGLKNPEWQGKYLKSPVNYFADKKDKINYMDDVPALKKSISYNNLIGEL